MGARPRAGRPVAAGRRTVRVALEARPDWAVGCDCSGHLRLCLLRRSDVLARRVPTLPFVLLRTTPSPTASKPPFPWIRRRPSPCGSRSAVETADRRGTAPSTGSSRRCRACSRGRPARSLHRRKDRPVAIDRHRELVTGRPRRRVRTARRTAGGGSVAVPQRHRHIVHASACPLIGEPAFARPSPCRATTRHRPWSSASARTTGSSARRPAPTTTT